MACDKCFTFMESFYRQTELMSDEQALRFFKSMCAFAFDDVAPDFSDDLVLKVAWVSASASITNNLKSRADGKKGGRPRKSQKETGDKTGVKTPLKTLSDSGSVVAFEASEGDLETPLKTPLSPKEIKGKEIKGNKRKSEEEKRHDQLSRFYSQTV